LDNSSVIIAPYESSQFYHNALLDDFVFRVLGKQIPEDFQLPEEFANPRLSRDALEYMLAVNRSAIASAKKDAFTERLVAFSQQKDATANKAFQGHGLLSRPQRVELLKSAKADDARLAKEYLGREDCRLFYQPLAEALDEESSYPGLSIDTAVEISEHIIGRPFPKLSLPSDLSQPDQIAAIVDQTAEAM
jgi:hypothetical protein